MEKRREINVARQKSENYIKGCTINNELNVIILKRRLGTKQVVQHFL
jgi:hypothetical protein